MNQNEWINRPKKSGYHWFKHFPESNYPEIISVQVFGDECTDFTWSHMGDDKYNFPERDWEDEYLVCGPITPPKE